MRRRPRLILSCLLLAAVGCTADTSGAYAGIGEHCGEGTACEPGLICAESVCRRDDPGCTTGDICDDTGDPGHDVLQTDVCSPDCAALECGIEPSCGTSCGTCPESEGCYYGLCFPKIHVGSEVDWVTIPGGSFLMGSEDGEWNEWYVHEVMVPTFDMARTEVTVDQYRACLDAPAGCTSAPDTGDVCNWGGKDTHDHPVNCVDWYQAREFCAWAGGRLPSESEWEYAARSGGLDQIYPWGDEPATGEYVVMNEDPCFSFGVPCEILRTSSVCSRPRGNTAQGLCDMAGNVSELLEDDYFPSYDPMYSMSSTGQGHPTDGTAWVDTPRRSSRVVRGSFYDGWNPDNFRAANRSHDDPLGRRSHTGFRCAR